MGEVAAVCGVRSASEGDVFRAQFLFYAGFAEDEDFAFLGREVEDSGDVD